MTDNWYPRLAAVGNGVVMTSADYNHRSRSTNVKVLILHKVKQNINMNAIRLRGFMDKHAASVDTLKIFSLKY